MAPPRPLSILVAEDNPVNQKVIQLLLRRLGYGATCVSNGLEAVEAARQFTFDLILMDCQMPEMDGFEATRQIRVLEGEGRRHVRIVSLTANALAGDRERCLAAGMDDYLSKPVRSEELASVLNRGCPRPSAVRTARLLGAFAAPVAQGDQQ